MGKKLSIGVSAVAHKGKKMSIGVNNVAHKAKKACIGDANGKARLFWSGGGLFIAPCAGRVLLTSEDGRNWTESETETSFTNPQYAKLVYGNGVYVLLLYTGGVYYSYDGLTWTLSKTFSGSSSTNRVINFCNNKFVVLSGTTAYTSTDGITWTTVGTIVNSDYSSYAPMSYISSDTIVYGKYKGKNCYIIATYRCGSSHGYGLYISTDLINWSCEYYDTNSSGTKYTTSLCSINNTVYWAKWTGTSGAIYKLSETDTTITSIVGLGSVTYEMALSGWCWDNDNKVFVYGQSLYGNAIGGYVLLDDGTNTSLSIGESGLACCGGMFFKWTPKYTNSSSSSVSLYYAPNNGTSSINWTLFHTLSGSTNGIKNVCGIAYGDN